MIRCPLNKKHKEAVAQLAAQATGRGDKHGRRGKRLHRAVEKTARKF